MPVRRPWEAHDPGPSGPYRRNVWVLPLPVRVRSRWRALWSGLGVAACVALGLGVMLWPLVALALGK